MAKRRPKGPRDAPKPPHERVEEEHNDHTEHVEEEHRAEAESERVEEEHNDHTERVEEERRAEAESERAEIADQAPANLSPEELAAFADHHLRKGLGLPPLRQETPNDHPTEQDANQAPANLSPEELAAFADHHLRKGLGLPPLRQETPDDDPTKQDADERLRARDERMRSAEALAFQLLHADEYNPPANLTDEEIDDACSVLRYVLRAHRDGTTREARAELREAYRRGDEPPKPRAARDLPVVAPTSSRPDGFECPRGAPDCPAFAEGERVWCPRCVRRY